MTPKEKKCKGTGKAKGHGCNTPSLWRKYGLCNDCYRNWLLNTPAGAEIIKKSTLRASRKVKQDHAREHREWKEKNKSIQKLIQDARKPFQQYIRMRDANNKCISCPSVDSDIWDAGHFKKAELYTGMIFDERNCHKQCRKCNVFLDGNEGEYRKRLIEIFGPDWVDKLDDDANARRTYKYSREELIEIKVKYQNLLKNESK